MHIGVLVVGIFLVFALLAGGFLASSAAKEISAFGYENDTYLKPAHAYAAGAASVDFIIAIIAIVGAVYLTFKEGDSSKGRAGIGLIGVLVIVGLIAAGVLAILGAQQCGTYLEAHPATEPVELAKVNLIWASVFSFVSLFLVLVGLGVYYYYMRKSQAAALANSEATSDVMKMPPQGTTITINSPTSPASMMTASSQLSSPSLM